jgi:hypothetical protein
MTLNGIISILWIVYCLFMKDASRTHFRPVKEEYSLIIAQNVVAGVARNVQKCATGYGTTLQSGIRCRICKLGPWI